MIVLGITGGTGGGKTTLLARVAARGGAVIDCDAVYHDLLKTDRELLAAIEARFPGVVEGGVLDRKKLGKVVFGDSRALADLNTLTHPFVDRAVRQQLSAAEAEGRPLAAIDAIALVESGLAGLCHETIAVTAPLETRVQRLMAREGISEDYARLRIAAQKPDEAFSAQCGRTIVNDYPTAAGFSVACDRLLDQIMGGIKHG